MDLATIPLIRPQGLVLPAHVIAYYRIGRIKYCLGRPVILLKLYYSRIGIYLLKIKYIPDIGAPELIDRLVIIAHYAYIAVFPGQELNKLELDSVRILILINHDVPEPVLIGFKYIGPCLKEFNRFKKEVIKVKRIALLKLLLILGINSCHLLHAIITGCFKLKVRRCHELILGMGYS